MEEVLRSVEEWRAGGAPRDVPAGGNESRGEKSEAEIVRQNQEAMRQLQKMMPGLGV